MFLLAKRINILLFVMFSFCFNSFLTGQSLISNPESVAFDTLNNRYLVSCFGNSTIVEIDSVGTQSVYKSNIGCLGNCIHENVLYVSSGKDVIGFDLSTDDKVFEVNIKEAGELDGITADSDGNLINVFDGNSSVNFFEAGSYGLIPATEQLVLGKEWSILCWVNLTSLNRKTIIDKKMLSIETSSTSLGGNVKNGLIIKLSRNDNTTLKIKGNANSLTTNRWHHIAISYSIAQQEFLCFVNGIQQTLSVNDSTIMATEIAENINSPIIIGNRALLTQHLLGAIDELQIWNKALSQNEISSLIDNPPSGSEDNLSGYWKMNEGNGIIFYDIASNNNGELINGAYCCGYDPNDVTTVNHPREKVSVHNLTFSIEQNYPNPFNPSTNINFTIPSSGNVKIILFNVLGEKVFDLMEQNLSAGKHSYMFSEKTLSSGVYFYSIVYGGKAITKKMILLR